jgi:hypothetical protein
MRRGEIRGEQRNKRGRKEERKGKASHAKSERRLQGEK